MALSSSTFQIPFLKHRYFGMSQNLRTPILTMSTIPRDRLISSFHTARSKLCSPLRTISCVAGDDETREASSLPSSISSLFVKGFSDSVSEGRLKKVFSEFGQVTNEHYFSGSKNHRKRKDSAVTRIRICLVQQQRGRTVGCRSHERKVL
ncbi:RNA recognition motif domain [Arabidopsis thaliana x Arabidopsis arenosa]|uniref:RNA-binding (RRM/RBD/RNP motifs) family protein n=3 Tax=Arabidopsis TaxID=3701 RepID=F4JZL1_ARATH|nr:RNA-binding (RRM/RBD/RNP motifs) family protein [Arabidopsis thaliana]AED92644.2 RNA-binding (RRM/RBD/RNP motifs) family protein [Arabidopsis thaliana]KAG7602772.1 RNA recognition motif domain [Arabidopsis thaliana x Arabidopsis arenosa]KAG7609716.1 RNA recognition motif domain [Arabidopsis suecica]|eukprot:NP_974809.2 RNA-binding (RRM/RBD/RNP motifs) family protein [Arabidopsis thaliana]